MPPRVSSKSLVVAASADMAMVVSENDDAAADFWYVLSCRGDAGVENAMDGLLQSRMRRVVVSADIMVMVMLM